jgi:hypothetical protein
MFHNGNKKYEMQQTVQPGDQMWLNFADLIHNRVADRKGNILPPDLTAGTYDVEDLTLGPGTLLPSGLGVDSTWGRGNRGLALTCCGIFSGTATFNPDSVDLFMGDTELVYVDGTDSCSDQRTPISFDFTDWWTGIPAIATMTTGQVKGVSAGTTTGYAKGKVWEGYGTNCAWVPVTVPVPVTVGPLIQWNGTNITGTTQSAVVGQKIALRGC